MRSQRGLAGDVVVASDIELVRRAKAGDPQAMQRLLKRHDTKMRWLAWKILGNAELMGDALQDAYLNAYKAIGNFRGDGILKLEFIEEISLSDLPKNDLIFEAPQKGQQSSMIRLLGADVNLSNIPSVGIVGLETLRLGLRSDTALPMTTLARRA